MKVPFKRGNILLPKNADMTKWSVVACDQYTVNQNIGVMLKKLSEIALQH